MISPEPRKLHRGWPVFLTLCLLSTTLVISGCSDDSDFVFPVDEDDPPRVCYYGIWGTGPDDIFVVGQPGVILHSDDNGDSWEQMESGVSEPLIDIWGTASDDIYVCGNKGRILHYNGTSWESMSSGTSENLYSIGEFEDGHIYACGYHAEVRRLSGSSWVGCDNTLSLRNEVLAYLRPAPRDTIQSLTTITAFAFGGTRSMLVMSDPVEGWELRNAPGDTSTISGAFSDVNDIENNYMVTSDGRFFGLRESNIEPNPDADPIWRKTWVKLNDVTYEDSAIYGIWPSVGDTTFHATRNGHVIMMMPDDGTEIIYPQTIYPTPGDPPGRPALYDLTGFSTDNMFAVGDVGTILRGSATEAWLPIGPPIDSATGQLADKSGGNPNKFVPTN